MKNQTGALAALAFIPLIITLGNSMLIPVLPVISSKLHVSSLQTSLLIMLYAVAAIIVIPFAGYLSDRYGRKKIILPSLFITAVGGVICVLAAWLMEGMGAYYVILAGRLLQGIGAAGAFPIVIPLVGDLFQDDKEVSKGLGLIETANTMGKVLSPILGAYLAVWLWFAPFIAIPILCLIAFVLVMLLIKPPKRNERADDKQNETTVKQFITNVQQIFKQHGHWLYAIFAIGGICMFALFGVLFYLSETLETIHNITGATKGYVLAIPLCFLCISSYGCGKLIGSNQILMKWIVFGGVLLLTITMLLTGFWNNIYYMITLFCLCCLGIGAVLPCMDALITESIEKQNRGTITSLYSSVRFLGVALGPPLAALLVEMNHWAIFVLITALGIGACLLALFAITPKQKGVVMKSPLQPT